VHKSPTLLYTLKPRYLTDAVREPPVTGKLWVVFKKIVALAPARIGLGYTATSVTLMIPFELQERQLEAIHSAASAVTAVRRTMASLARRCMGRFVTTRNADRLRPSNRLKRCEIGVKVSKDLFECGLTGVQVFIDLIAALLPHQLFAELAASIYYTIVQLTHNSL
jgi:hypothetical protein